MKMATDIGRIQLIKKQQKRGNNMFKCRIKLVKRAARNVIVGALMVATIGLSGCANMTNEDGGMLAGGAVGGLLGSRFGGGSGKVLTTMVGTLAGALIGGRVGRAMDKSDRLTLNNTLERNRTGQTRSWTNPDNHHRYKVTPTKTYKHNGRFCRKYKMTAIIDGKAEIIRGKACRNKNGVWKSA